MKLQTKFLSILVPLILAPLLLVSITAHQVLKSNVQDNSQTQTQIIADQLEWKISKSEELANQYINELQNSYVLNRDRIETEINTFHALRPGITNISAKDVNGMQLAHSGKHLDDVIHQAPLALGSLVLTKSSGYFVVYRQAVKLLTSNAESIIVELTLHLPELGQFIEATRRNSHIVIVLRDKAGTPFTQDRSLKTLFSGTSFSENTQSKNAEPIQWNQKQFLVSNKTISNDISMEVLTPTLNVRSATDKLNALLSYIAIGAGLLSVAILHKSIAALVTSPLARFQRHTQNIVKGNTVPVNSLNRSDEIGDFARSFDEMRQHLLSTTEQIEELAYYDTLTGLPNKVTFIDTIQNLIEKSTVTGHQLAIVFFDLDNFKHINDGLGHEVGDNLLMEVGNRLKECIRSHDIISREAPTNGNDGNSMIARLGGDEFTLVLSKINSPEEAAKVANRILQRLGAAFDIGDNELFISASIGISMYPKDGKTPEALLKSADTAMYAAKSNGKNNYHFYNANMNKPVLERIALESSMRSALENQEFILYFQPKVPLDQEPCFAFETLMRWKHPEKGMVSPGLFIPLAEDTGYIHNLGDWAIEETCKQIESWNDQGYKNVSVSVNLSPVQLNYGNPIQTIKHCLEKYRLSPSQLEIEITESGLMQNEKLAISLLNDIKALGVRIALDDFGTGYSSMAYLLKFPIDTLKIDRAFINDIESNPESLMVLEAIISLAKNMNLHLVAEGVETKEQLEILQARQCNYIQGFYFAKPTEAQEAIHFFNSYYEQYQEKAS
ncbi:MAG: EAL domain-containing protein [Pseudomonadales bacterium]|nr:EAL domain-containing protein [Pseudomonadales bacterium]